MFRTKITLITLATVNATMSGGHVDLKTTIFSSGWNLFPLLDDRMELVHEELYLEIKRKLYSGRKDDPNTPVEVRIDQDVFTS